MNMLSIARRFLVLPAILAVATLTGCASQMTQQDMTPAPLSLAKQHPQSVTVSAMPLANAPLGITISEADLGAAVSDAIAASKAFAQVKSTGGDYLLTVQIFNVNTPTFGIAMTSSVEAGWTLKRADTGAVVWQQSIKSEHTTGGGEAFAGAERAKMSIAGAIKKNISMGIERIGAASL